MDKVTPIEVYVFRKTDQQAIFLHLYKGIAPNETGINRFRWMIKGLRNPFPVRNGTWFQGFEPAMMIQYLAKNGFEFSERVNLTEIQM